MLTRSQRYYRRHKEKVKEANRRWAQANPQAAKAIQQRYDAKPHRQATRKAYKLKHRERWQPDGRYYRPPYPFSLRETIRLLNELKRNLQE